MTKILESSILPRLQNQPPDGFMVKKSSYVSPFKVGFTPDHPMVGSYDAPPPFLSGSQYFSASEEVEGQGGNRGCHEKKRA